MEEYQQFAPKPTPGSVDRWRLRVLALCVFAGFIIILGRLFYVQIIKGAEYRARARKQYETKVELRPQRGNIVDREGRIIATTVQSASYAVDPKMVENKERICALLAPLTNASAKELLQKISNNSGRNFVWLARGLNVNTTAALDSLKDIGLIRLAEPRRNYVYASCGAQVVGSTNVDNVGTAGVELAYDSLLHGASGFAVMQKDGKGRLRPSVNSAIVPVQNGNTVQLTIDMELQQIVENELREGVGLAGAQSGTVIVLQPNTGEILALASYPGFNPAQPESITHDAMRIRAITDMYEPGSTFKLVTCSALLEEKVVSPNSEVDGMDGTLTLHDGTVIRDHEPLGVVTLQEALEKSSNIVFANLAKKLDSDVFYKYTRNFGFGIPSGVDIPGEVRGILKKPHEYDRTTKMFMAYGYELASTGLQVANAYATIANNGVMMKPYIVKRIVDASGAEVLSTSSQKIRQVVSESTAKTLTRMLVGVVEDGTAKEAHVEGLRIAGKTGTAQQLVEGVYSKQAYTASFCGYFPADNPKMVILVMLDKPTTDIYGGRTAAPIFRKIVQRAIMSNTLVASIPELSAVEKNQLYSEAVLVPDVRGLEKSQAEAMLHQRGLRLQSSQASGYVIAQSVKAGTKALRGTDIDVKLRAAIVQDSTKKHTSGALTDVRGLTLRRAMALLHSQNVVVKVQGSGKVVKQTWSSKGTVKVCLLECE